MEIKEKLIRGDLKLVKAADKTLKRLVDIPFRITSQATGESHVILTDKNGEASTGAYWNPHTVNTNEGKTSEDGIWFGEGTPDNTRGALPYGTYLVEELSCKNNEDRMLIPAFEVEVTKEMRVIDLGTLTNDEHPVPEIGTRASDRETGTHNGKRTEQVTVIDQVKWKNLEIGKEYVVKGTLMDKETKKPVLQDGKEVTAEKKLIPDTDFGEIQMEFTFDATKLKGEQVVVFEEVYLEEKLVAAHADLEDEGQSVTYKKEKPAEEEKPESPEKPKETEKAKTVATGDGSYVKILIFLIGVLSLCRMEEICRKLQQTVSEGHMEESLLADKESIMMGIASRTSSGQRVVDCSELQRESKYQLEQADLEVLLRIVEAEAGCEDEDGKLLVANVILNRLNSEKFPDSITEIVFQRENGVSQFSPIADGSYYKVSVSEETVEAVGRALAGEDISRGALYFAARKYADSESMRWFDEKLTLLFRHGGHEFFSDKKALQ